MWGLFRDRVPVFGRKRPSSLILLGDKELSLCSIPLYRSIWYSLLYHLFWLFTYVLCTVLGMKWLYEYVLELPGLVIVAHSGSVMALCNGDTFFSLDSNQEVAFLPKEEKYNPSYCLGTETATVRGNTDGDRWLRLERHLQSRWTYAISGLPCYISSHIGSRNT